MKIHQHKRDALLDKTLTMTTQHESLELISAITLDMEFLKINLSQLGRIKGANLRGIVTKSLVGSESSNGVVGVELINMNI